MNHTESSVPSTTVRMEASAPKTPPVRMSGPLVAACSSETPASPPETAKPKMLPWKKFQDQWMPTGSQRVPDPL